MRQADGFIRWSERAVWGSSVSWLAWQGYFDKRRRRRPSHVRCRGQSGSLALSVDWGVSAIWSLLGVKQAARIKTVIVLGVVAFAFSLPRAGRTAKFVGTRWEPYVNRVRAHAHRRVVERQYSSAQRVQSRLSMESWTLGRREADVLGPPAARRAAHRLVNILHTADRRPGRFVYSPKAAIALNRARRRPHRSRRRADLCRLGAHRLVALASGIGAKKLLGGILSEVMIVATGSVLVLFAAFCFIAGVWRDLNSVSPRRGPQPRPYLPFF
jgi:hypothetical protein